MSALSKYAIVLASGVAIGWYVNGPISLEQIARLARIDETNILLSNASAHLTPETAAIVVESDAGHADEDLDYLIAKRIGTLEGWQAFLVAHASQAHAESAEAEIDKLSLLMKASEPAAVEVLDRASPEAKIESEAASPSGPSEAAALPLREDSEPGKLQPQVASLTDSSGAAASEPNSSARVGPGPGAKPKSTALHRWTAAPSIPLQRGRSCAFQFQCHWKTQALPPILMALFGVKAKHSTRTFGQTFADARPSGLRGRGNGVAFSVE